MGLMVLREVHLDGKADLHMHTVHSDGALAPTELVKKAQKVGLKTISITDHDSVNGLDEAIKVGTELDVVVIPGVELSATINKKEIHLLGYFINHHDKQLLEFLSALRGQRVKRAERIVDKLNKMNVPIKMKSVLDNAGNGSVGRPHVAEALVQGGYVQSYQEAFDKYIKDGAPAYEQRQEVSPTEMMKLVTGAGGLTFLAHPGRSYDDETVARLIDMGLDGIEVVHPSHSQTTIQHFRRFVHEHYLLESGGSDFHGGMKGDDNVLGTVTITGQVVNNMRRRLFSMYDDQ